MTAAVNFAMVQAYWEIGEQIDLAFGENDRAEYGKGLIKYLSDELTKEFGKGFNERNTYSLKLKEKDSMEDPIDKRLKMKKKMMDEHMFFRVINEMSDYEGYMKTSFLGELTRIVYNDTDDEVEPEEERLLKIEDGVIIPSTMDFEDVRSFFSVWDFCDSMDSDIVDTYETMADMDEGIKREYIQELGLQEEAVYESSILYIWNIASKDEQSLDLFLALFDDFLMQLPSRDSQIAVVVINKEQQSNYIDIFKANNWRIKAMSKKCGFAYRRI